MAVGSFSTPGFVVWALILALHASAHAVTTASASSPSVSPTKPLSIFEAADKAKDGEEKLEELEKKAEKSKCWKHAVEQLRGTCAELDDKSQGELALALTNCHLNQFGRRTYPCHDGATLAECTAAMDGEAFGALSTFTAHTSNVCFFLANQLWQERTEKTVNALSATSQHVVGQLNESAQRNQELLRLQQSALGNQEVMLQKEVKLQESLDDARKDAEEMAHTVAGTVQQYADVWSKSFGDSFQMLARIEAWMSSISKELLTAEKVFIYILFVAMSFVCTSAQRTSDARLWLLGICMAGFVLEYIILSCMMWITQKPVDTEVLGAINTWIRRLMVSAGLLVLSKTLLLFEDYARLNAKRLEFIEKRIEEVQSTLDRKQRTSVLETGRTSSLSLPESGGLQVYNPQPSQPNGGQAYANGFPNTLPAPAQPYPLHPTPAPYPLLSTGSTRLGSGQVRGRSVTSTWQGADMDFTDGDGGGGQESLSISLASGVGKPQSGVGSSPNCGTGDQESGDGSFISSEETTSPSTAVAPSQKKTSDNPRKTPKKRRRLNTPAKAVVSPYNLRSRTNSPS